MSGKAPKKLRSIAIFAFCGFISIGIVSAQKDQRERRGGDQNRQQNSQSKYQEQYDQQKAQNQQRYEQRQQSYQEFHRQRIQPQPQQPAANNQDRVVRTESPNRVPPAVYNNARDRQNRESQYAARQLNDRERQQILAQTNNWDRSERSWQTAYNSRWQQNQNLFDRQTRLLQQQNRLNQYAFQQAYWDRVREDRDRLSNWQFYNDVALDFSYLRGGQYYYTSQYGVNLLKDAANDGYQEGFLAGQADREDNYRYDFRDALPYQDASYGYNGYWVDLSEYQYYFRQGFQNGYDDGFYSRYRYGAYANGKYAISANVLGGLLNFSFIGR